MPTAEELRAKAEELRSQLAQAQADAELAESGQKEPETAEEAHDQLLGAIVNHLGNHPKLEAHLTKLRSFKQAS